MKPPETQIDDPPRRVARPAYDNARGRAVDRCAGPPDVLAVYGFGEVGAPGISDVDLLVVFRDSTARPIDASLGIAGYEGDDRYVLCHNPFLMPASVWRDFGSIFHVRDRRLLYGEKCEWTHADDREVADALILADLFWHFYPAIFHAPLLAHRVNARTLVQQLYGLRFVRDMLAGIGAQCPALDDVVAGAVALRGGWFDAPEEKSKTELLRLLDAATDATLHAAWSMAAALRDRWNVRAARPVPPLVSEYFGVLASADFHPKRAREYSERIVADTGRYYRMLPAELLVGPALVASGDGPASQAARRAVPGADYFIAPPERLRAAAETRTAAMNRHVAFYDRNDIAVPMVHRYYAFIGHPDCGGPVGRRKLFSHAAAERSGDALLLVAENLSHNRNRSCVDRVAAPLAAEWPGPMDIVGEDERFRPTEARSLARRMNHRWYGEREASAEIAAHRRGGRHLHYLNVHSHFHALRFEDRPTHRKITGTVHQPVSTLKDDTVLLEQIAVLDGAVAVSTAQMEFLEKRVRGPVRFIPMAVDADFYAPPRENRDRPFEVLFVGQWLRDLALTSRLASRLFREGIPATIVIPSWRRADLDVDAGVRVVSEVSEEYLRRLYHRAGCVVLPLVDATACCALLEAGASGAAVVLTDVGGVRDYVDDSRALLVEKNVEDSFMDAVMALKDDEPKRRTLGDALRRRVVSEFNWPRVARDYVEFFRQFADAP
ncbi:MAG: glycosyltransferase [Deltaproteobacteria bacterium]|nr:glycosyltransferase [Deltaproteobacteria bacterium]